MTTEQANTFGDSERTTRPRRLLLPALMTLLGISTSLAFAADAMSQIADFGIPPQSIKSALHQFSKQADVQVMVSSLKVAGQRTNGVRGRLSAANALTQLLQSTSLTYETVGNGNTVAVKSVDAASETSGTPAQPLRESEDSERSEKSSMSSRPTRDADGEKLQSPGTLETVIVSAQKREEKLQDVPIAISVLGGAALDRTTDSSMTVALSRVPGVTVSEAYLGGGAQIPIRGVASGFALFAGSSPTAYYLDSVPFAFSKSAIGPDPDVYDLDRIEVLRGPQGTLYGASALNGVVRILSRHADLDEFEFKARTSGSSTDGGSGNYRADAALNVPLVPGKLAARAVVGYQDLSGWIDKPTGRNVNDAERSNYRFRLDAAPTDRLSLGAAVWLSRADYGSPPTANDQGLRTSPVSEPTAADYDVYSANIAYDFDAVTITSASSYLDYENRWFLDIAPPNARNLYDGLLPAETFSQEVTASSSGEGPWRWTAGGIYRDSKDALSYFITNSNVVRSIDYRKSESFAVYGELTREFFGGQLEMTVGLRHFEDQVRQVEVARANGSATAPPKSGTFTATTPRVVLTWHPSETVTAYMSYGEGFRSGAFQSPTVLTQDPTFPAAEPDKLTNYEVGSKAALFNGRLTLEAAAFYIDWEDVQQSVQIYSPAIDQYLSGLINGSAADGVGAEFSASIEPLPRLILGGSASWNDLAYKDDVFSRGALLYRKGERLGYSSEYTASASADYSFPVSHLEGRFSASANYTSAESHAELISGVGRHFTSDSMLTARASAALGSENGWTATIFADNITNESGSPLRYGLIPQWSTRIRPRTVGLQFEFRY